MAAPEEEFTFTYPRPKASDTWSKEDTFRIMLATDNHIGYLERDPIRGQDSINTFKEILQLAVKHDVDFVLLAGDLFHENRPSRDTLYQVMALLREYTMSDRPIQLELLSDPDEGKAPGYSFPAVNYEDPNLNVGMPVFSIHGNHDDPQGAGPEGALCALDMLSVAGLINYMGKIDLPIGEDEDKGNGIAIKPVMLRKGSSKLAMYGIGNVKDQRLHYELRSNRVRMFMPRDKKNWFNILLIHQNRVPHGPQQSVPEGMFDNNVDLVVWGHEHDCRVDPEEVPGKRYKISQPGSSVATSLSEGESIEKHVAILNIHGKEYYLEPIPLRTVRPFVMDEMVLADVAEAEGWDLNDQNEILRVLKEKVHELIASAEAQWQRRNEKAKKEGETELPPMLPLIRLKVDTTGVREMSNPIRFGLEFQGQIANPRDVLVFQRAKRTATRSGKIMPDQPDLGIDDPDLSTTDKLSKLRMQTLVREYLSVQEMQLLAESGLSKAIETFVEKDDIHAIEQHVQDALKIMMSDVRSNVKEDIDEELDELVEKAKERAEERYAAKELPIPAKDQDKGKGRARGSDAESVDSMAEDLDFDVEEDEPPPKKTAARGKKAAAPAKKPAARGRKKAVSEDEEDDDEGEEEEEEAPRPTKRTNRAVVLNKPATKTRKAPAKKTATKQSTQATLSFAPTQRGTRAAAAKAKKKTAAVIELDSDDD